MLVEPVRKDAFGWSGEEIEEIDRLRAELIGLGQAHRESGGQDASRPLNTSECRLQDFE